MYEFEVLLKNGERTFIWGYNYQDALNRHPKLANEIESLLFQEYIDLPFGRSLFLSVGRWRTPRPVFRVNRRFAQFSIRIFGEFDERNFPEIP
jgi:hypothetical protein